MKTQIITSAFPFVPAEINIAHLSSTYLPADVYTRYQKLFGNRCCHISATDVHSIYASKDGLKIDKKLCEYFHEKYKNIFDIFKINFDCYQKTDVDFHLENVKKTLELLYANNTIYRKYATVLKCADCNKYLPKRFAIAEDVTEKIGTIDIAIIPKHKKRKCYYCSSKNIICDERPHWFLKIEKYKNKISQNISNFIQDEVRKQTISFLKNDLQDWNISRDNTIGLPFPFDQSNCSLYLWFESLVGYDSIATFAGINNGKYVHFIGKNIIYYHTVILPVILTEGLNCEQLNYQISARGFMDFSKSDKIFLDFDSIVNLYNVDYLRFYLVYKINDNICDFYFTEDEFKEIINKILCNKIGNLLYRIWFLLNEHKDKKRVLDKKNNMVISILKVFIPRIKKKLNNIMVFSILYEILDIVKLFNDSLGNKDIRNIEKPENRGLIAFYAYTILYLLYPIIPGLVEKSNFFCNMDIFSFFNIDKIINLPINTKFTKWEKI